MLKLTHTELHQHQPAHTHLLDCVAVLAGGVLVGHCFWRAGSSASRATCG